MRLPEGEVLHNDIPACGFPTILTVTLPGIHASTPRCTYSVTERIRFQANVENLANQRYYLNVDSNTNISSGSPRVVRVGLTIAFSPFRQRAAAAGKASTSLNPTLPQTSHRQVQLQHCDNRICAGHKGCDFGVSEAAGGGLPL